MKQELQQKIYEDCPLLFGDRFKGPRQTCMYFGIETGDGWFDLIYDASCKIEKEIEKYLKENQSTKCYNCWCDKSEHGPGMMGDMECLKQHYLPYRFGGWNTGGYLVICWHNIKQNIHSWHGIKYLWREMIIKKIKVNYITCLNRISQWLFDKFNIGYYKYCHCKNFERVYPRASQIKEKFGTLRFYMTSYTDEIDKIVTEAEKKSEETCEHCGKPGTLRTEGWLFTLCDECQKIRKEKGGRAPWL